LFYKNKIDNDKQFITLESDYSTNLSDLDEYRASTYSNNSLSDFLSHIENNQDFSNLKSKMFFFRVDHCYDIKKLKVESGLKCNIVKTDNNIDFENLVNNKWINDSSKSNHFIFTENIFSGYVSLGQQVTQRFSYLAGLRGSYTCQSGQNITSDQLNRKYYAQLLPSVFLEYGINDNNEISLNYDRLLDRPPYESLNPFKYYDNPLSFVQGNPDLNPSIKDKIVFSYRFKTTLFTSLTYVYQKNMITLQPIINQNDNMIIGYIFENFEKLNKLDLTCNFSQKLFKEKIILSFAPELFYVVAENPALLYSNHFLSYYFFFSIDYTPCKKTDWDISFYNNYSSGLIDGYDVTKSYNKCGISLSRSFFHNDLNLSLELNDIFNSDKRNTNNVIANIRYNTVNIPDSRYIRLSISYSFSSKKVEPYNRHGVFNEEKGRIK